MIRKFRGVFIYSFTNSLVLCFENGCEVYGLSANRDFVLWELSILKDNGSLIFEEAVSGAIKATSSIFPTELAGA